MADVKMSWSGDQILAKTNQLKKTALEAGANMVKADAKLRAPVDTGQLRASIQHQVQEDYADIGTNVEYAASVEFGTARQRPQPYLRPALDENSEQIKNVIAEILKGAF